jgi:hypothetical protein
MASTLDFTVTIVADRAAGGYRARVEEADLRHRRRVLVSQGFLREDWDEAKADADALTQRLRTRGFTVRLAVHRPKTAEQR